MKPKAALIVVSVASYELADQAIDAVHHASTSVTGYCLSALATLLGAVYLALFVRYLRLSGYHQRWPVIIFATAALGALGILASGYFDRRQGFVVYFLPVIPALFLKPKIAPRQEAGF